MCDLRDICLGSVTVGTGEETARPSEGKAPCSQLEFGVFQPRAGVAPPLSPGSVFIGHRLCR